MYEKLEQLLICRSQLFKTFSANKVKDLLSITVLTKLIAGIFFAKKLLGKVSLQKLLTCFWQKYQSLCKQYV